MSRQPVVLPTSLLLYKDITAQGFWINRWIEEHSAQERIAMLQKLSALVKQGKLKFAIEEVRLLRVPQSVSKIPSKQERFKSCSQILKKNDLL